MKLSGTESCIKSALTKTKSPIVCSPRCTASADMIMITAWPRPKITPWPKLSQPSEVQTCVAAFSYRAIDTSKRLASISSLPKYLTVSKFRSESIALVLASVSLSFIVRRMAMRQSLALMVNQI
ncbi:hypothetical protein D3C73_512030 [compost metagenome]